MVALYARLYLALTSSELLGTTSPAEQTVVVSSSLFDYFYAFNWFRQSKFEHWLLTHKMEYEEYLALHSPAVEWLVKCAAPGATQDTFDTLLAHYQEYSDSSMVLKHLCECFGAQFYASTPTEILDLIRTASPSLVSKCHLYSLVAVQLSNVPAVAENEPGGKLQFLNGSWSSITSQDDITQYMECAAAYMKLIVAHFSVRRLIEFHTTGTGKTNVVNFVYGNSIERLSFYLKMLYATSTQQHPRSSRRKRTICLVP